MRILSVLLLLCSWAFAQSAAVKAEENASGQKIAPSAEKALPPSRCRVMVIVSWDPEKNIYKHALDKLGIENELFQSDNMTEAIQRLDEFDLVMSALNLNLTKDLEPYAADFKDWVNRGGGFCIFDACNGAFYQKFVEWLTDGVTMHPTGCNGFPDRVTNGWVYDTKPGHPLRNFPMKVDYECSQWHCLKKIEGWDVVATCSEKGGFHPVTVVRHQGRGFIYVSSMQQRWTSVAADLRCYLACSRLGLKPLRCKRMELLPGKQRMFMRFDPMWGSGIGKAALTIKQGESERKIVKPFSKIKDTSDVGFVIPYELAESTDVEATLSIGNSEGTVSIPLLSGKTEPYLAVRGPRYRNVLSVSRRVKSVKFIVNANPPNGRTAADKMSLTILDPQGRQLARKVVEAGNDLKQTEFEISVDLPMDLPVSDKYQAMVKFQSQGKVYAAENKFEVRGNDHPGGVIMDEDMTMLVDGKPFFPLVIYHLKMHQYPDVLPIGFNTVTTFQWLSRKNESFIAAEEHGLKVFFENNEKYTQGLHHMPAKYSPLKSMLMWYLPDEPLHEKHAELSFAFSRILEKDKFHPRTVIHYNAPRFRYIQNGADIIAPDLYYINKKLNTEQQNYAAYANSYNAANAAVNFNKPVMMVVSAFGFETYPDFLMTAFIPIARGVRGLMWYAWDEGHGKGLSYVPEAQQYLTDVISKIKKLEPDLLCPERRPFTEPIFYTQITNEGGEQKEIKKNSGRLLYGIVCGNEEKGTAIVVNPSPHAIPTPAVKEAVGKRIKSVFEGDDLKELMKPFSVRAFRWNSGGAKPGVKRRVQQ